jgi:hypothetical protein
MAAYPGPERAKRERGIYPSLLSGDNAPALRERAEREGFAAFS